MDETTGGKAVRLRPDQAERVNAHFKAVYDEQIRLQKYLEGIGVHPVDGWPDPGTWRLVSGIDILDQNNACHECSVVCFDGSCDCKECNNPQKLWPEPNAMITVGARVSALRARRLKDGLRIFVEKR